MAPPTTDEERKSQIEVLEQIEATLKRKQEADIAAGRATSDHAIAQDQLNIALGATAVLVTAAAAEGTGLDKAMGGVFETISTTAKASLGVFEKTLNLMDGVYNTASKIGGKLRQEYREIQNFVGGGFGELGTAAAASNNQAQEAVRGITDIYESFYRFIPETQLSMFELFENEQELSSMYMSIANDTSRATKFLAGDTVTMTKDVALGVKGLGLSMGQARALIDRQIDMTGEANTDLLRNMAKVTKATEDATGVGSKIIAQNTSDMLKNVQNFGNMTQQEMAATSAQLAQVGIDFQALNGIVGKFQSFEGATAAAADLNAVFGVQIDSMEMMMAANQGQHHVLDLVRRGMIDAGVTSANLTDNMAKARVAAQSYGTDVKTLQRILSAQDASEIEEILKAQEDSIAAQEQARGTTDFGTKEMADALDADMARVQRTIGKTAAEIRKMAQDQATAAGLANIRSEFAQIAEDAERVMDTGVIGAGIAVAPMSEMAEGAMSGVSKGLHDAVGAINDSVRETASAAQETLIPIASLAGEQMAIHFQKKIYDPAGSADMGGGGVAGTEEGLLAAPVKKVRDIMEPIKDFTELIEFSPQMEEDARLFGAGLGMIIGGSADTSITEALSEGLKDIPIGDPEVLAEKSVDLISGLAEAIRNAGLAEGILGRSPSEFGEEVASDGADGVMLMGDKLEERLAGRPLINVGNIIAMNLDSVKQDIDVVTADIVASFDALKDLNLATPSLTPIDVNLTSRIRDLNEATQALIESQSAPLDLNLNLNMVIDDDATAALIKKFKVGSVTGGERVLTVSTG